jgi:hypothetical protein
METNTTEAANNSADNEANKQYGRLLPEQRAKLSLWLGIYVDPLAYKVTSFKAGTTKQRDIYEDGELVQTNTIITPHRFESWQVGLLRYNVGIKSPLDMSAFDLEQHARESNTSDYWSFEHLLRKYQQSDEAEKKADEANKLRIEHKRKRKVRADSGQSRKAALEHYAKLCELLGIAQID